MSARNTLDEHNTSIEDLGERYDSLSKTDEDFWTDVASIVADAYNTEVPDISEEDFDEFIKRLVKLRFNKEFRKSDVKKLGGDTDVDTFVSELKEGDNIVLQDEDSDPKIIYVGMRTSRDYIEPLQPTDSDYYPPLLLQISTDRNEVQLSGNKGQRNKFVAETASHGSISLQDEEPEVYEELDIEPEFIQNLKDRDIFLSNIRISGDIALYVSSDDGAIDVQDFVDYDLLLQDKQDILQINSCEFVYISEEDVDFSLNFQTFKRPEGHQEFIKISLELKEEYEKYREEIEDILMNYGVEVYEPYYKPPSHYFNNLLSTNRNYRDKYYAPLEEMEGEEDLDILLEEDVIDPEGEEGDIEMDKDKLGSKLHNKLEESERIDVEIKGRQHRIADLEDYEDGRISLVLKSYSDGAEDDHRRFYRVIIPVNARPKKFEKIYNIVLSRVNFHKILTSESDEEIVEYIIRAAQRQMKYHQRMLIEKEARRSAKVLEDYYQNSNEFRENYDSAAEAGYVIEDHLNVILRYMFRDYLYGGGKNQPDGALQLQGKPYLVDSKQSIRIPQTELSKSHNDLSDSKYSDLVESDNMLFIISRELLFSNTASGSLNPDARERVSRDEETTFHFISVNAVCVLYEIFSENINLLSSSHEVRNDMFSTIKDMIEESQHADDCEELEESEDTHLGEIRRIIDGADYIPEDRHRYF